MVLPEHARDLLPLSADELAARLKEHVEGAGGLITPGDAEIARECPRRARMAEAPEEAAIELLEEVRALVGGPDPVRTESPAPGYRPM